MCLLSIKGIAIVDKHRKRFFWQEHEGRKRYHLVKWSRICRSKNKGGLGVKDLRKQNINLLTKWWWKLETQQGLWQEVIRAKYLKKDTVTSVKSRFSDSPIWKAIMKVKEYYLAGRKVIMNSGNLARVWKDSLHDELPMEQKYPMLYNICNIQEITVEQFRNGVGENFFRRQLHAALLDQCNELNNTVNSWVLSEEPDQVVWNLGKKRKFTTRSVYDYLERNIAGCNYRWIWQAKIPLKNQIFMWQTFQGAILTRDVMSRRRWAGNPK